MATTGTRIRSRVNTILLSSLADSSGDASSSSESTTLLSGSILCSVESSSTAIVVMRNRVPLTRSLSRQIRQEKSKSDRESSFKSSLSPGVSRHPQKCPENTPRPSRNNADIKPLIGFDFGMSLHAPVQSSGWLLRGWSRDNWGFAFSRRLSGVDSGFHRPNSEKPFHYADKDLKLFLTIAGRVEMFCHVFKSSQIGN